LNRTALMSSSFSVPSKVARGLGEERCILASKSLAIRRPVANSQIRWRFEASRVFDENIALFEGR
jgi:hypothetical protein